MATTMHGEAVELTSKPAITEPSHDADLPKGETISVEAVDNQIYLEGQNGTVVATKSTYNDAENMRRMGKDQQFVRHFRTLSVTSFAAIATAAWELGIFLISPGLINGGRAGLIWSTVWNFICFGPVYLSMAEMASMAPIAGAQYHWVSEFAPEKYQRVLSYFTGWTSTLAYQAGNALGIFVVGSCIQTIIIVNDENYLAPAWQCTLLALGAVVMAYIGNVYGARILPYWQNAVFAVHILGYFAFLIPIWINAPATSHSEVWTEFANYGGWSSMGLAILVGQLSGISAQVGVDTSTHMSEEVKDAAGAVPRAIISVYLINFALFFPCVVTICYHIPSIEDSLADPTTYPAIYVLRQAMSPGWVTVILVIVAFVNTCGNITYLAAVTRDIFAFARDDGLPFSNWLRQVHPTRRVPQNATIFSSIVAILLAMIYIGSPLAFYAITSLLTVALLQCYCLSIGCVLWRRIAHPETLPPATFSLGKWGIPMNVAAVAYSAWSFFWSFWPQEYPITAAAFNWASPIFFAVIIGSGIYFLLIGKRKYFGPVTHVRGRNVQPKY